MNHFYIRQGAELSLVVYVKESEIADQNKYTDRTRCDRGCRLSRRPNVAAIRTYGPTRLSISNWGFGNRIIRSYRTQVQFRPNGGRIADQITTADSIWRASGMSLFDDPSRKFEDTARCLTLARFGIQ